MQNVAPEVICLPIALSNQAGWNYIGFWPENTGGLWLSNKGNKDNQVYTVALDSMMIPDVTLIKIDVENSTMPVLEGALNTIRKYRPNIIAEVWERDYDCMVHFCKQEHYVMHRIDGLNHHLIPV